LQWLRATDQHPTAARVHEALRSEMPALSLGTVYRNLEILVAEGLVDEVPCSDGASRYDGNVEPHHHFNCESCGQILDVELPTPRGLRKRLAGSHGLHARRVRISFFGLCATCEDAQDASTLTQTTKNQEGKKWAT
jgi:Fe2+ or Zn2+ uptake regulation protein